MRDKYLYRELASLIEARSNCLKSISKHPNSNLTEEWKDWAGKHMFSIFDLVKKYMPSGSGFDAGTAIDLDRSNGDKLVFTTSFHHMNPDGFYAGWTTHEVVCTPSLAFGFHLRITGPNKNNIKEYISDVFTDALWSIVGEEE